jgi:adenine-specific DNA methylase
MFVWARDHKKLASPESYARLDAIEKAPKLLDDGVELRKVLLDFIADFANWDNSTVKEYLETARALTQAAHEALGGEKGTRPLVVDPFAGGGAIPLEALRVGADAFASDLNPVAVLLNKVVLEYIPKYGQQLADEVRKWGKWIKKEAEKELAQFYPIASDGATPIAYLWARTIICEGPGCGAEVPLIRSLWLAKKGKNSVALQLLPRPRLKRVDFKIIESASAKEVGEGTVRRGSASCPCCGYTTPVTSVRAQLKKRHGGTADARMLCIVTTRAGEHGRTYRLPTERDLAAVQNVSAELARQEKAHAGRLSLIPNESTEQYHSFVNRGPIYGMKCWHDYFTARQALALSTLVRLSRSIKYKSSPDDAGLQTAVRTCLALVVDRQADASTSLCRWHLTGEKHTATFGRQALPMVWDFSEVQPLSESTGGFSGAVNWVSKVIDAGAVPFRSCSGQATRASATRHPLPDDAAQAFFTDTPYYFSVQYADLSDFFYVWLKRSLEGSHGDLLGFTETPKDEEIIVQSPGHEFAAEGKNNAFYERMMGKALAEGRRILAPPGIGVIVFAHTATAGWEAMLQAMIDGGWVITGSWPIDTEMATRVIAQGRSVLASSVHLVCRPRENPDGSVRTDEIGDWRDVLQALPIRIHEWMPRLAEEGVVGADAIFACLGPALEIFSRYSRVEKASGEVVTLKEYLEQVWAAVSKEALTMIFEGAQTTGFEEDARLTAMWLWTLSAGAESEGGSAAEDEDKPEEEEETSSKKKMTGGFSLEYDAARKIAQGLGAHLEQLGHLVEVKGDTARLLPVAERTRYLFGKDDAQSATPKRKKKEMQQTLGFEDELEAAEEAGGWGEKNAPKAGETVLDRVHQAMILFAAGRSDALKRFLVEDGIGRDDRFWVLAQALSALYPKQLDEKRWVDGVLARKKGLGF